MRLAKQYQTDVLRFIEPDQMFGPLSKQQEVRRGRYGRVPQQ
jgi:hypothetical protein